MAEAEFDMNAALRRRFRGKKAGRTLNDIDLDKVIFDVFPKKYQRKMSRVIWDVCEASEDYFSADELSERLIIHVNSGRYVGYGNLERWAHSEIGPEIIENK